MKDTLRVGLILVIIIAVNVALRSAFPALIDRDTQIDGRYFKLINRTRPQVILLGNSLLAQGVDRKYFSFLTKIETIKIKYGGAASAFWYLVLKNIILGAKHRTDTVVIFFRDTLLTKPGHRVLGKYKINIDRVAGADEPVLDKLAYLDQMDWIRSLLTKYSPLYRGRYVVQGFPETVVKNNIISPIFSLEKDEIDSTIDKALSNVNMDFDLLDRAQFKAAAPLNMELDDFNLLVNKSFLPEIISLAKNGEIQLIFVRMKRRRDLDKDRQPHTLLNNYIEELKLYLNENDIPLIDFTYDERIREEHYRVGDHFNSEGRELFTELLAEELMGYLRRAR